MRPRNETPSNLDVSPQVYARKADRTYLKPEEAEGLIRAAGKLGRKGLRDQCLVRLIFRHGLRASEAANARWTDFDLDSSGAATFHVRRLKGSNDSMHTLRRDEVLALRKLREADGTEKHLFISEVGKPLSVDMIARVVQRAGETAGLGHVHPHMLRHSAGYSLANMGHDTRLIQDYLGHRSISNTVRYTALAPSRLAAVQV